MERQPLVRPLLAAGWLEVRVQLTVTAQLQT
jgi:hypothetical protein